MKSFIQCYGGPGWLGLLFLILSSRSISAQGSDYDLLVKRDGTIIEVLIVEIRAEEILYRKKGEPEGPIYAILKADLLSAKFRNGETATYTVTIDHFYDSPKTPQPSVKEAPVYRPLSPANDFEKYILALPSDQLEHQYLFYRAASRSGRSLGLTGSLLQVGINLAGTLIILANSETDALGNTYSTNDRAVAAGGWMLIGGTLGGLVLGPVGFLKAAKNGNKAKYIRGEMRRRGVPLNKKR